MQIFDISLSTQSVTPTFDAVQYDSARECGFYVEEDISGYDTVEAKFTISTGRLTTVTCTVDDHLVSFILPLNLTRQYGQFDAVVSFVDSTNALQINTFPFRVDVRQNPASDGDTYELAYENMIAENTRAETNNTTMESIIAAFGTYATDPASLQTMLSALQSIWANFEGQDMSTLSTRLDDMEIDIGNNASNIQDLSDTMSTASTVVQGLVTTTSNLSTRLTTAEGDIDTLEGLADNAVYHD